MTGLEIERKFLVASKPPRLRNCRHEEVEQGYLAIGEGGEEVRVRRIGGRHVLTAKAPKAEKGGAKGEVGGKNEGGGQKGGASRKEMEVSITARQFDALWPMTAGRRVSKVRYRVAIPGAVAGAAVGGRRYTAEVDVYRGTLRGLVVAEVEFPSEAEAEAFEPPPWFGREVTADARYKNQALARDGRPAGAPA